ncbi:MAG: hypothetical protein OQL05_11145 [Gammaproteobacteria bacterium]|nr:hypothetical protein [Gammaproteobacteria bacterium]MCW8993956.1 hypothetical protein [Gammaproteobacteria bacterium]
MNDPIVVIGTGEMSGVFTRGFLKLGYPVFPVNRHTDMEKMARALTAPALVLVAVGEADLHPVLDKIPSAWEDCIALLQNELLPRDWEAHDLQEPTVIAVWFEKKKGQDYKVLIPSPTYGVGAPILEKALATLDIPTWEVGSHADIEYELVRKNVYILTTNITGLELPPGTDVEVMWSEHQAHAREIADEVMDIQFLLIGKELDREKLTAGMVEGIEGDLRHKCMGRSAPARLKRNLGFADEAGLTVPRLRAIAARLD